MKAITSLILLVLLAIVPTSLQQPSSLPSSVTKKMAQRAMRYHHMMFHNMRNYYLGYNASTKAQVDAAGWKPPRPSKDKNGNVILDNNAGEDFLYMHRQMIALVNSFLAKAGRYPISGFKVLPAANDQYYPMPASYNIPYNTLTSLVRYYKTSSWYKYMKSVEVKLQNATFLRTMTLGQLGTYIEYTSDIHQGLHFRFSGYNTLMRNASQGTWPVINTTWDVPNSNWLVDLYCSQVNPWFWKVHGWIDNQINNWQIANNLSKLNWTGTWMGGSDSKFPKALNVTSDPSLGRFLGEEEENKGFLGKEEENKDGQDMGNMDMDDNDDGEDPCKDMNVAGMEELLSTISAGNEVANYYSDLNMPCANKIVAGECPYDECYDDDGN